MGDGVKKFYNPDDSCTYFYDREKQCYMQLSKVGGFSRLPPTVRQQILAAQEDAQQALLLPTK